MHVNPRTQLRLRPCPAHPRFHRCVACAANALCRYTYNDPTDIKCVARVALSIALPTAVSATTLARTPPPLHDEQHIQLDLLLQHWLQR